MKEMQCTTEATRDTSLDDVRATGEGETNIRFRDVARTHTDILTSEDALEARDEDEMQQSTSELDLPPENESGDISGCLNTSEDVRAEGEDIEECATKEASDVEAVCTLVFTTFEM